MARVASRRRGRALEAVGTRKDSFGRRPPGRRRRLPPSSRTGHGLPAASVLPSVGSYVPMTDGPRGIDRLLELQDIDTRLDRLGVRRAELEGGEEAAAARLRLSEAERALGEFRLAADEAAREQRKLEGDADGFQQKISGEERRLFDGTVANPKELESIQHEITNLRNRKSRVEDEQLEVMERREQLDAHAESAETAVVRTRTA